jgi:hypothetical protein
MFLAVVPQGQKKPAPKDVTAIGKVREQLQVSRLK